MDFRLFETAESAERVAYFYDIRNLITHNYGIVDKHFLVRHPDSGFELGATIPLRTEFIHSAFDDLIKATGDIQARAQQRFGLFYETTVRGEIQWWEK